MTSVQAERAARFAALHVKGDPLILFNVWDASGAKILAGLGAPAIATSSAAVADSHGCADGEKLPFELALANLHRIAGCVDLPVTLDLESGYGRTPSSVAASAAKAIEAGAVGINFEDQIIGERMLYAIDEQAARIEAIRRAAETLEVPLFINARTDIFLFADPDHHTDEHLDDAVRRADAYAEAGASGFFAPGLIAESRIAALCERSPLPVNLLVTPRTPPIRRMAELGVARVSFGSGWYRSMLESFRHAAEAALASKTA